MAKVKVQITLDEDLVARLDNYADDNYMSRSGMISVAVTQYLNTQDTFGAIRNLSLAMRKIADTGSIDEETMNQLEDFERLSKMLVGK